jgi:CheY-like chemotaxis protein
MSKGKLADRQLVLIVDDDQFVRESLSSLLTAEGYAILEAENGLNALQVLNSAPHFPSVILLDLSMPVMDGNRFLERRDEDPVLRQIPVIVVSGNAEKPLDGVTAYLLKPVRLENLIGAIRIASS